MITNIGYKTYIVFMCFCIVGFIYAVFILPEVSFDPSPHVPLALTSSSSRVFPSKRSMRSSTTDPVPRTEPDESVLPSRSVSTRSSRMYEGRRPEDPRRPTALPLRLLRFSAYNASVMRDAAHSRLSIWNVK
jgi:hypothetical protein